ncbi:MAG: aminoacetone oxidase family FAD-binding enzyme [Clostridia bacterium]|nr:aminoacetone oxidase family FAD-binding enzyme [Clostridia bacterium]
MKTEIYDLAIIGAGASGLACAISAAQGARNMRIILLESKDRAGKKILATGNGKCNLSNTDKNIEHNYHSSDIDAVNAVFNKHGYEDNISFFASLGLICRTDDEGRIYPYSQHSSSVLDSLRNECERLCIETRCSVNITDVKREQARFNIITDDAIIISSSLVVATGGMSYVNKQCLSGYDILKKFGHTITPLYPSLVALKTQSPIKSLKGIRFPATVTLYADSKKIQSEVGEVQFTENGISGIAVMQLSQRISRGMANGKKEKYVVSLDLMPSYTKENIIGIIKSKTASSPDTSTFEVLCGMFHKMLSRAVVLAAIGKNLPEKSGSLNARQIESIAQCIKEFEFNITDTMGFANAQVTGGGARLDKFNAETMESTITAGLYAVGEVVDVVGACGGFNLNWAWSSGRLAGESIAKRSK